MHHFSLSPRFETVFDMLAIYIFSSLNDCMHGLVSFVDII